MDQCERCQIEGLGDCSSCYLCEPANSFTEEDAIEYSKQLEQIVGSVDYGKGSRN